MKHSASQTRLAIDSTRLRRVEQGGAIDAVLRLCQQGSHLQHSFTNPGKTESEICRKSNRPRRDKLRNQSHVHT